MWWGDINKVRREPYESYLSYTHRLTKDGFSLDMIDSLWNQSLKEEAVSLRGRGVRNTTYGCPFERVISDLTKKTPKKIEYAFRFYTSGISKD